MNNELSLIKKADMEKLCALYVKQNIAETLTKAEFHQFLSLAYTLQLNPLKREIYAIKYGSKFNILVGYQIYLSKTVQLGKLESYNIEIQDDAQGLPEKGTITVKRTDQIQPVKIDYKFKEWAMYDRTGKLQSLWATKPTFMFRKTILATAFREVFPEILGSMPYTNEELWYQNQANEAAIKANIEEEEAAIKANIEEEEGAANETENGN